MVANVGAQTRPARKTQQFSRRNVDTFSIILYRGVKTTLRGVPFATALPNAQHTAHTVHMHARASAYAVTGGWNDNIPKSAHSSIDT